LQIGAAKIILFFAGPPALAFAMLYAVLFTDNADHTHVRQRLMPAHLDFLEQHREHIRAAGPLLETEGSGAGGLWLVETGSPQAVMELVQADPFWPTGLRKAVRVLQWAQVFAEGRRAPRR
jgi:uncharacterized protein YciI